MRLEMTCCCGASFDMVVDDVARINPALTLKQEAELWRKDHALCPTYARTVTTTMAEQPLQPFTTESSDE